MVGIIKIVTENVIWKSLIGSLVIY